MNTFYGVKKVGQNFLINQLEINMKSFLEWGFLNAGGFVNVHRSIQNVHANSLFKLYPIEDPNFNNGQIWQTAHKGWVYESGIVNDGVSPIPISGIYIGNDFYDTNTTGDYQYSVDYKNSRIIFNKKLSTRSNITMSHSYKWVQIYNYTDAKWWQQLQYNTDSNSTHLNQTDKGDFYLSAKNRVQLPAIIIETVARGTADPFQLGDKSLRITQDFLFHIVADNYDDRNNLIDILRLQEDKVLTFYDVDKVVKNQIHPINYDGTLNPNRVNYDLIVGDSSYTWRTCRLKDMIVSEVQSVNSELYEANIRTSAEIIIV